MQNKSIKLDTVIGIIIILLFIGLSYTGLSPFETMERCIYDMEMNLSPTENQGAGNIVLIDIDDKSLASLGPWPWPRSLIAEMIDLLKANNARLIGLNLPFTEKESNQGLAEVKAFHEKYEAYPLARKDPSLKVWVLENLDKIEKRLNNDPILVDSVGQSENVVMSVSLGTGALQNAEKTEYASSLSKNSMPSANISSSLLQDVSVDRLSPPFPELAENAMGLGHDMLTIENGMRGRSHPLFIRYDGMLIPSFPLRLAIAYFDQLPGQLLVEKNRIQLKDNSTIPITHGKMLVRFSTSQDGFRHISFDDLLKGNGVKSLKGKIAIIGLSLAEGRRFDTPVSHNMCGSELTAQILENIINGRHIKRPSLLPYMEILIILVAGLFALLRFPRKQQLNRLTCTVGLIILTFLAGVILFIFLDIWFKTVYITSCLAAVFLYLSARDLYSSEGFTESHETNRMLGLSFQSQGLLDLAFDKFRKLPLNNETKNLIYNLGLDFEKRRMISTALGAYEFITKKEGFRDLEDRIPRLKQSDQSSTMGSYHTGKKSGLISDSKAETRSMVDRYEIIGELGQGAMGTVYKAQDPKINRLVAIKTIRFSDEFDDDVIQDIKERFFREAEIAGRLAHPSIVTIHDVGDDRDLTYMAMEFLEGEDLDKFTKKGNLLHFRRVLDVIASIAEALDFAHKAEVIHRDIKPANVMLLKNGTVKVMDFGIAKAISSSRTKTGVILGTPNYMSPEQIMGQKIDARSDIFSLGVLFYQMITGVLPFHGENLSSLLYQITQVKHTSARSYRPKIPKISEQIIDKALAKNPDHRFKSAGGMAKVINLLASKIDQLRRKMSV